MGMDDPIIGYRGFGKNSGKYVDAEVAFEYAAEDCGIVAWDGTAPQAEEFAAMLVEWYFSGDWVAVTEHG